MTVPRTVAVNCRLLSIFTDVLVGEIVTPVTVGLGALTVIVADPALLGSATLVAVTTEVPAVAGAVYTPDAEMLPLEACHVTA